MIYFLRHGLDDEAYIGGWSDVSLIDEGRKQVVETLKIMQDKGIIPKRIIVSDIKRACETADLVSEFFGLDYETTEILREQDKGKLNGMLKEEAIVKYPEYFADVTIDTIYPEGESLRNLYDRIKRELEYFYSLEEDTLVVTHRGVINMLYYLLENIPLDMDKKKFDVVHASVHEFDKKLNLIRKVI